MNDSQLIRPRICPTCRRGEMTRIQLDSYAMKYHYEGALHTVTIQNVPIRQCASPECGARMLDSETNKRLDRALRDQLGILQPEAIRANRERLGLSRRELANAIGIDEAMLELYEMGGLTPRAIDRLLRKIFEYPEVRKAYGLESAALRTTAVA